MLLYNNKIVNVQQLIKKHIIKVKYNNENNKTSIIKKVVVIIIQFIENVYTAFEIINDFLSQFFSSI